MNCPRCGAKTVSGKRFCGECGSPLPWICSACGSENPSGNKFCGDCGAPHGGGQTAARERVSVAAAPIPERRQLTVMFADLVGSTPLGGRLDPEDLREVIATYHGCVASVVARFDGFVAHYVGDGVLVYFGYPQAHEDDAERAARAALAVIKAVDHLETVAGPAGTLRVRIGIATGLVVVGDLIGSGSSLETSVVGETPNLAARLQTLADPGMVVISETTRRLTGGLFEYRQLGPAKLKGMEAPVHAWAVLAESTIDSRFEALRPEQVRLVGRREEIELLRRRWEQAKSGSGRVVLLSGEPGMGKSRLIAALEQELGDAAHLSMRFLCSPYYQDTPLHPVIRQIERSARFQRGDSPARKWDKLRSVLVPDSLTEREITTLGDLLSIPGAADDLADTLTPQRRKERTFSVLLKHFRVLARQHPIVVVFEDVHWADPTTRDLLDLVIETVDQFPVLFVVTTRPELQPSWASRAHASVQLLNALDRPEAVLLINALAGERELPPEVINRIIMRADGVPLFIEELTRTVLDTEPRRPTGGPEAGRAPLSADAVPVSLQASLMARLDRLTVGKDVAQTGSVIGREFSFESLQAVTSLNGQELEAALRELVQAGLIIPRGQPPEATYTFKHALVQDAAYASLLRDRRRAIHLRLAGILERDAAGSAAREPELLAWHFAEGGSPEQSITYYEKAAAVTTGRFALTEQVTHLRKALAQVRHLADPVARQRRELDLQVALGRVLIDCHGSGSEEVRLAFERARELCLALNDTAQLLRVHDGLMNYHFTHCEPQKVLRYATEMFEVGQNTGDPQAFLMARRSSGFANLLLGRFEASRRDMEELVAIYRPERDGPHAALTTRDPKVSACTILGICLTAIGCPESGRAASLAGVQHGDSLNHPISLILGLRRACVQRMMMRDPDGATEFSSRLHAVMESKHETFLGAREGIIFDGWARLYLRRDTGLMDRLRTSLAELDAEKHWAMLPFFIANVAEIGGGHGDIAGAAGLLERAAELAVITGEQWYMAEITRLQARFNARTADDPMTLLQSSLATAREQGARLWELRTATDVARLWLEQDRADEARDLLAPIYGWFTEGFHTPDLVAARALLEELNWQPVPAAHDAV
jgi:class 3 adenylate cyclase